MTSVIINGDKVSTIDAVIWASKEFGQRFKLSHEFPGCHWKFDFEYPEQATLFALKWAE